MLTLSLVVMLAQTGDVPQRPTRTDRVPRGGGRGAAASPPFFEFAPTSGVGMGAACDCTTPTGSRGETLTLTRASNGTCTKTSTGGLATTGIANGDLVVCSTNQPRIEYDGSGYLGLLVESARTNSLLRSQEIDNAAWTRETVGAAAATVTADFGTAPDGTATADRIQSAATIAGQASAVVQAACPAGFVSGSIYLKGNGTSGTTDLCINGPDTCSSCAFVVGSWSRCVLNGVNNTISGSFFVGNETYRNGGTTRSSNDFLAWGAQCEAGTYVTSYIPTAGTAVARAYDTAYFALNLASLASNGSSAASVDQPKLFDSALINLTTTVNVIGVLAPYLQNVTTVAVYSGGIVAGQAVSNMSTSNQRLGSSWTGTTFSSHYNGNTVSGTGSAFSASNDVIQLCDYNSSHACDGIVSRVCVDTSSSRCR